MDIEYKLLDKKGGGECYALGGSATTRRHADEKEIVEIRASAKRQFMTFAPIVEIRANSRDPR